MSGAALLLNETLTLSSNIRVRLKYLARTLDRLYTETGGYISIVERAKIKYFGNVFHNLSMKVCLQGNSAMVIMSLSRSLLKRYAVFVLLVCACDRETVVEESTRYIFTIPDGYTPRSAADMGTEELECDEEAEAEISFMCEPRCQVEELRCIDRCPDGWTCDDTCVYCEQRNDRLCVQRGNSSCIDLCPTGQRCDETCELCVEPPLPIEGCSFNQADNLCTDTCPEGLNCDARCRACVEEPSLRCTRQGDRCLSDCPEGYLCDESCGECVPRSPPPTCERVDEELCRDRCEEGFVCDEACERCVPRSPTAPCRRDGDQCISQCDEGLTCDERCELCVRPPPARCRLDGDQCISRCGEGLMCDERCEQCVRADVECVGDSDCPSGHLCEAGSCELIGLTCAEPRIINTLPFVERGVVRLGEGNHVGSCGGAGIEHVYALSLSSTPGQVERSFEVCIQHDALRSSIVYLRSRCDSPSTEGICINYPRAPSSGSIDLTLAYNQVYYLMIDGDAQHNYTLSIELGACESAPPPSAACRLRGDVCLSDCPSGMQCDSNCERCVR